MARISCGCKRDCTLIAVVVSVILGVVAAFLQITGVITVTPVFLWVAGGVAAVYLAVLLASAGAGRRERQGCCRALNGVLAGILGTIVFALVLLAVGITATSILSAILVGILVAFFALILTASACLIRCQADCGE